MHRIFSRFTFILNSLRWQVVFIIILYLLLDAEYRTFIVPRFANLNFKYSFDLIKFLISTGILAVGILSVFLFKPSPFLHNVSVMSMVLILIPNLIFYQYNPSGIFIPLATLFFIILLRLPIRQMKLFSRIPVVPRRYSLLVSGGLTLLLFIPVAMDLGFHTLHFQQLLNTGSQYKMRDVIELKIHTRTFYILGQLLKALIPAGIVIGFVRKNSWYTLTACLLAVYFFLVYPHKTFIIMLLPLFLFVMIHDYRKQAGLFLTTVIAAIIITRILSFSWNILPESLLVRRIFFTQAFITHAYFDFFKDAPIWFSDSFMHRLIHYPYELSPAFQIGKVYFDAPNMSCNTGFIGVGFMQMGYAGVFIFGALSALVFHFINQLQLKPEYFGLSFLVLYQMANSSPVTLLITHGLVMLLLLMMFILREKNEEITT
jgi:hypothetical protein